MQSTPLLGGEVSECGGVTLKKVWDEVGSITGGEGRKEGRGSFFGCV